MSQSRGPAPRGPPTRAGGALATTIGALVSRRRCETVIVRDRVARRAPAALLPGRSGPAPRPDALGRPGTARGERRPFVLPPPTIRRRDTRAACRHPRAT